MDLEPPIRSRALMALSGIPAYEPMLAAYHRAFALELRAIVGSLPIAREQRVLDMACGAGTYTPWLADRVGSQGRVVAVDSTPHSLEIARHECAKSEPTGVVEFLSAPIDALPFAEGTFDLCWCAHSLYRLPDSADALRRSFTEHLKAMSSRPADNLNGAMRRKFEALAKPEPEGFLLND